MTHCGTAPIFLVASSVTRRLVPSTFKLRQLYDALLCAIADFFDISWLGVAALIVVIFLLSSIAFIRTNYSWNSHQLLTLLLFAGVFIALAVAGKTINRR